MLYFRGVIIYAVSWIICSIGGILLMLSSIQPLKKVIKTKNTSCVSDKLLLFFCITSMLFVAINSFGICSAVTENGTPNQLVLSFDCTSLIANFVVYVAYSYVYDMKKKNLKAARAAGMTEIDHYNSMILPSLISNMPTTFSKKDLENKISHIN